MVDELLKAGDFQILGVDRDEKSAVFLPYLTRDLSCFRLAKLDLNKDMPALQTLLLSEQPDYVMNLAALSEVAPSWDYPEQWMQTNLVALTELADHVRRLPALKRFVQISTPEVYGSVLGQVKEGAPLNPSTPYAASKASFDLLLGTFVKRYSFPVVYMRASNVYGPHQQLFKIVPRTIIYLKMGKKLKLHGGGTATRAFIHVRDVARAYIAGMLRGNADEVFHVSPDQTITIRSLVKLICDLLGEDFAELVEAAPARPGHDEAYQLNSTKAHTKLGWQPEIALTTGLTETIDWIEKQWAQIKMQSKEYVHQP